MQKSDLVRAINGEIERLEVSIRGLLALAASLGCFIECRTAGLCDLGCARKEFVEADQSPPAGWLSKHDRDYQGTFYLCGGCASKLGSAALPASKQARGWRGVGVAGRWRLRDVT